MKIHHKPIGLPCMALIGIFAASCSEKSSHLPEEFKLERPIYQTQDKPSMGLGPGGLNQSFAVYELPQDISATIAEKGLSYLNSLPSALARKNNSGPPKVYSYEVIDGKKVPEMTGPWWSPFMDWHATPVPKEEKWLRYGRDLGKDWQPSIATFYPTFEGSPSADKFISTIPPEFSEQFHQAISTPGNFYAYGYYRDMCLIVVSPKTRKVFYLFRD